jgi:hypothetical protein
VTTRSTQPPWEFLLSASKNSLQSFELSRLSHAANIRKEIGALLDQWMDDYTNATLARLLLQERERSAREPDLRPSRESRGSAAHSVSDNFLADRTVPLTENTGPS